MSADNFTNNFKMILEQNRKKKWPKLLFIAGAVGFEFQLIQGNMSVDVWKRFSRYSDLPLTNCSNFELFLRGTLMNQKLSLS